MMKIESFIIVAFFGDMSYYHVVQIYLMLHGRKISTSYFDTSNSQNICLL